MDMKNEKRDKKGTISSKAQYSPHAAIRGQIAQKSIFKK